MTIYFPDVSNYQTGLSLAGAVACIAKASEGTTFTDRAYPNFKSQAQAMGIPFCAYHWLHASDVPGQARHAFSIVGASVPLMIDDEDTGDGLDINRTLAFVNAYRALGGTVTLEYLPHWFWQGHGSPSLTPLVNAGLSLVSSSYTAYTDTGPGWVPYGGMTPAIWQYTSSQPFNGYAKVDFNAYRGTVDQLRVLFNGGGNPAPPTPGGDDMTHQDAQDAATLVAAGYDRYGNPAGPGANLIQQFASAAVEARLSKQMTDSFTALAALVKASAGGGMTPEDEAAFLAKVEAAAKAGAEEAAPTHDELVQAAFEGSQEAEDK